MFDLNFIARRRRQTRTAPARNGRAGMLATFAAGCFWGVEASFREVHGVLGTRVGYTGGELPDPTYEQVCRGETGHAEAVEVRFDPRKVSYEALLEVFWQLHDPTTPDRQGWDLGTQYRSAIFTHDAGQIATAVASRERAQLARPRPIVTRIVPADVFHAAEPYHQQYFEQHGGAACAVTIERPSTRSDGAGR